MLEKIKYKIESSIRDKTTHRIIVSFLLCFFTILLSSNAYL